MARPRLAKPVAVANIPYGFLRAENIAPQIFPVGDQLAVVPSFTGDGMAIALNSGILAARAVLANQSSESYQRNVIELLKPQFRLARGIGTVLESPATCTMSIVAGQIFPSLMRSIASATRANFRGLPPIGIKGQ
jgi:flavin-dependent dehydrogenase